MKTSQRKIKRNLKLTPPEIWAIWGTAALTLYFNSKLMDPFNSPKFWILMVIGSWLLGYLINNFLFNDKSAVKIPKSIFIASMIFICSSLISGLMSDDKYIAFFGENLRRNGFLSYFYLVVLFIFCAKLGTRNFTHRYLDMSLITAFVLIVYAIIQKTGNDFISWNNPYNSVILTLGNPNFSSALLSILFLLILTKVTTNKSWSLLVFLQIVLLILVFYCILATKSRQGLVSLLVGLLVFGIFYSFKISKMYGALFTTTSALVSTLIVAGMLQKGPLESILYKPSVSVRGYYWRAGIEMFKDNILFGVGLDSYGSFFKQFREIGYPLNYGFNITSNNAHNVPIQLLATGGIFVGLSYLFLIFMVIKISIGAILKSNLEDKKLIVGLLASFLAFQSQSLVSIDNLGLSIWGWGIGGALVGLSFRQIKGYESSEVFYKRLDVKRFWITVSIFVLPFFIIINLYQNEVSMMRQQLFANSVTQGQNNIEGFESYAQKTINVRFLEPRFKFLTSINYFSMEKSENGIEILTLEMARDPRNQDLLNALAFHYGLVKDNYQAINVRNRIANLDPYNAQNYLELGRLYKLVGDYQKMNVAKDRILGISNNIEEAKLARTELVELLQ
jgi:O-antigen ligase